MGKASRNKRDRRQALSTASSRSRRVSIPWITAGAVVLVLGALLVVVSRDTADASGPAPNRDHWHAALGVNVCGSWAPDAPTFEYSAAQPSVIAGIHTHGDGLVHVHPTTSADAAGRATLGRYFEHGGWELSEGSFSTWTGESWSDGDECPDGRPGRVVWSVDGEVRAGDPADLALEDLQVIALGFLPEGEELGRPPSAARVERPADLFPEDGAPGDVPGGGDGSDDPDATGEAGEGGVGPGASTP